MINKINGLAASDGHVVEDRPGADRLETSQQNEYCTGGTGTVEYSTAKYNTRT